VEFVGTATYQKLKLIIDLRHELEHDKPEKSTEEFEKSRTDRTLKWFSKLSAVIKPSELLWVPRVRRNDNKMQFGISGEPVIMKFMKYPVAEWVHTSTLAITQEMSAMMFRASGPKNLSADGGTFDDRFNADGGDSNLRRLWIAGE
jgi:hypothetical protein